MAECPASAHLAASDVVGIEPVRALAITAEGAAVSAVMFTESARLMA